MQVVALIIYDQTEWNLGLMTNDGTAAAQSGLTIVVISFAQITEKLSGKSKIMKVVCHVTRYHQ